jgi:hypothetical protein
MAGSHKATQQALDDIIDLARIRKRWNKHDEKWAKAADVSLRHFCSGVSPTQLFPVVGC